MCGEEDKLYKKEAEVKDINLLLIDKIEGEIEVDVKTRYSAKSAKAKISSLGDDRIKIVFDEPQRAITPGQSAVFYRGDIVLGGGKLVNWSRGRGLSDHLAKLNLQFYVKCDII